MGFLHQQVTALVGLAALIACEGAPARSKPWRHPNPEANPSPSAEVAERVADDLERTRRAEFRDELRVGVGRLPNVGLERGDAGLLAGLVFEPLLPRLATTTTSADGLLTTVVLAEIPMHSGGALTAARVRRSFEIARRRGGAFADDLRDLVSIEVLSPRRLRFRQRRANGYLLRALQVVPMIIGTGPESSTGTGPYELAEVADDALLLRPFVKHPRAARLSPIEFVQEPDPARAIALVQTGALDLAKDNRPVSTEVSGTKRVAVPTPTFRYLAFNAGRSIFSDAEVRRAASLVIDRKTLARDGYRGRGRPRQQPIWPGAPIDAPAFSVRPADPRRAAELLDRAGWTRRSDGTRERDKQKLIAVAIARDASSPGVALVFDQLRSSGLVLDVRELDQEAYDKALAKGEFDVAVAEWRGFGDWDLTPILSSRGALNLGAVKSSVLDDALALMRKADSADERRLRAPSLAKALEEVVPIVALTQQVELYVAGLNLDGVDMMATAGSSTLDLGVLRRVLDER